MLNGKGRHMRLRTGSLVERWKIAQPPLMTSRLMALVRDGLPGGRGRAVTAAVKPSRSPAQSYGSIGDLEVRLAATRSDVRRAQRLRYRVFFEELRRLGYVDNGLSRTNSATGPTTLQHLRLERARWLASGVGAAVHVDGLAHCREFFVSP